MKRALGFLFAGWCIACAAQVPPGYPSGYAQIVSSAEREGRVVIYAATDVPVAAPLLKAFAAAYPRVRVDYQEMRSLELYRRFVSESRSGSSADVLWSPAMDLQMKLVNDGHAQAYRSPEAERLPTWAVWRDEAYGTTFEPVVFVYNKRLIAPAEVPQTHAALAQLLRSEPHRFKGKVATYDIEKVGVGFLLATQDSIASSGFWDLAQAMFDAGAIQHPTTGAMMERVASGESLVGYNLLGSYVVGRAQADPSIGYVMPRDYTLVVSRVMLIARGAANPNAARLWVDFVLSKRGQEIIANESRLFAVRDDVEGSSTARTLAKALGGSLRPIVVGPGLLAYQDQAKRVEFLRRWHRAASRKLDERPAN
jgi:iron(III) transport system substrate-binding protein